MQMTVNSWLSTASGALHAASINSGRLDALVLLEDATGHDRAWLLAHPETALAPTQLNQLADHLERRLQHEPLAYIRGHAEFYGRRFIVTADVLVPRPETEAMIDLLKKHAPEQPRIADIGTGSGALAITAVLETGAVAAAVDIDEACLAVAQENAVVYTTALQLLHGDVMAPFLVPETDFWPQVVLANLPYVPTDYAINDAARHEPALALFGGDDGLDLYRRMFEQLQQLQVLPDYVLTEALFDQHAALAVIAQTYGYALHDQADLAQVFIQRS